MKKFFLIFIGTLFPFFLYAECVLFVSENQELKQLYVNEFSKHGIELLFADDIGLWDYKNTRIKDFISRVKSSKCRFAVFQPLNVSLIKTKLGSDVTVSAEIYDIENDAFHLLSTNLIEEITSGDTTEKNILDKRKKLFVEITTSSIVRVVKNLK